MGKHHNIWKDFVSFWGPLWKGNGGRVTWLKLWNIIKQMQIHQRRIFYGGHESRHTWADPRLWSCHYRCWYGPTKLRFHFPRLQHKQILRTFQSWRRTLELSPPYSGRPEVTILSPPSHHTANAAQVAAIFEKTQSLMMSLWMRFSPLVSSKSDATASRCKGPPTGLKPTPVPSLHFSFSPGHGSICSWTDLGPWSCHHHCLDRPMSLRFHLPKLLQKHHSWQKSAGHSWADLGLRSCHHQMDRPRSRRFHLPKLQQKQNSWQKSAGHSWAGLGPWSCHHQNLDGPMSPRFHLPKLQQKHDLCHKCAGLSWAGLGPWSCLHHGLDCPMSLRFHLPKWQQKHDLCHKCAGHSWADIGLWSCHHHGWDCPRSPRFHLPKLKQKHTPWQKSAGHSWADLGLWSCHHQGLEGPRSPRFHLPKLQQKQNSWQKSAGHSWADLGLWSCHHHGLDRPRSPRFHLPKLQHKQNSWQKSAGHSWADLGLWSCHHHGLDCPRSPRFHLPRSQQKPGTCQKCAERSWADVGLWSCHHHVLDYPMSQLYFLHHTTKQTLSWLQLSLAAVPQQWCCLHFEAHKVEEGLLDLKDVHYLKQASGSIAPGNVVQLFWGQQPCHNARPRWFHCVHWAKQCELSEDDPSGLKFAW